MSSPIKSNLEEKLHYHNELIDRIEAIIERKKVLEKELASCRVQADILCSTSMSNLFKENEITEMKDNLDKKVKHLFDEDGRMDEEMDRMVFEVKVLEKELIPAEHKSTLRPLPFEKYNYQSSKFYLKKIKSTYKDFFNELNK